MDKTRSTPSLVVRVVLAVAIATRSLAQNLPVPPLPYSYGALAPFISEHALRVCVCLSLALSFSLVRSAGLERYRVITAVKKMEDRLSALGGIFGCEVLICICCGWGR